MPGGLTSSAIAAQPEWLRALDVAERLPAGARVLFTGCGTSYHAALASGPAVHALDAVLGNAPAADVLVAISHEGETKLTHEAVQGFAGETWLITGAPDSPIAHDCDHVVAATPEIEQSYCHTVSYTCAVTAGRALRGEDVSGLAAAVEAALAAPSSIAARCPCRSCSVWCASAATCAPSRSFSVASSALGQSRPAPTRSQRSCWETGGAGASRAASTAAARPETSSPRNARPAVTAHV